MPGCVKMVHTGSTTLDYSPHISTYFDVVIYASLHFVHSDSQSKNISSVLMFIFMIFDKLFFVCIVLFFKSKSLGSNFAVRNDQNSFFSSRL